MNEPVENWYRDSAPGVKPSATPSSSVPVPTPTGPTSLDGQCGGTLGKPCIGFTGPDGPSECCSPAGWCGNKEAYCGTGCNPLFGKCGVQPSVSASTMSAAPLPTASHPIANALTGECGPAVGKTCKGFTHGGVQAECCSQYGYCGNTIEYCGTGCNPIYGNCKSSVYSSVASSSVSISASVSESKTSSAASSTYISSSHTAVSSSNTVHPTSSHANPTSSEYPTTPQFQTPTPLIFPTPPPRLPSPRATSTRLASHLPTPHGPPSCDPVLLPPTITSTLHPRRTSPSARTASAARTMVVRHVSSILSNN
jgi:hypothetical protein